MQWAAPSRILLFVPSMVLEARRTVRLMPFSACKLPFGTTKLELVTSGRSVWISLWVSGQYSAAEASTVPCPSAPSRSASTNADRTALMAGSLRRIWPYIGALVISLLIIAAIPWLSIGFL